MSRSRWCKVRKVLGEASGTAGFPNLEPKDANGATAPVLVLPDPTAPRFPINLVRVPFILMFSFNKEPPKQKGEKGTAGVPRPSASQKSS